MKTRSDINRFLVLAITVLMSAITQGSLFAQETSIQIGQYEYELSGTTLVKKDTFCSVFGPIEIDSHIESIKKDPIFDYIIAKGTKGQFRAWNTETSDWHKYLQELTCNGKTVRVNANRSIEPTIGDDVSNYDVLRCENGHLVSHFLDGKVGLYSGNEKTGWITIKQIITIGDKSYYLKPDGSVWKAAKTRAGDSRLGSIKADYLQSNNNGLIAINDKVYQRYEDGAWTKFTPKFLPQELSMTDEGLWFFIQNKASAINRLGVTYDEKMGITMKMIPLTGNCDEFLWKVVKLHDYHFKIVNKKLGDKFQLSYSGELPKMVNSGDKTSWAVMQTDIGNHGTASYAIFMECYALCFRDDKIGYSSLSNADRQQTWIFNFNQMQKGYMLPRNDEGNSNYFDRKLVGKYDVGILGAKTTSDWALVNAYFIQTNMMHTVKDQNLIKNTLKGHRTFIINKNNTNFQAAQAVGFLDRSWMGKYRGGADPWGNRLTITEEMMCKVGVVNRPLDKAYRQYEQVVHEFTHILQGRLGPVKETNPLAVHPYLIKQISETGLCKGERDLNSECFCWVMQYWFNSMQSYGMETYPENRIVKDTPSDTVTFVSRFFNFSNDWMPPTKLRAAFVGNLDKQVKSTKKYRFNSSPYDFIPGEELIYSSNNRYYMTLQLNGNLAVIETGTGRHTFDSDTAWHTAMGDHLAFFEGNLIFDEMGSDHVDWETDLSIDTSSFIIITDGGQLKIISSNHEELYPNPVKHHTYFKDGGVYQIYGTGSQADLLWTLFTVDEQLVFRRLPDDASEEDIKKTLFKVKVQNEERQIFEFESVSNPGYFLKPIRPPGAPWVVGFGTCPGTSINFLFMKQARTMNGNSDAFTIVPGQNQAWIVGSNVYHGIGMYMPGAFGPSADKSKASFLAVPYSVE